MSIGYARPTADCSQPRITSYKSRAAILSGVLVAAFSGGAQLNMRRHILIAAVALFAASHTAWADGMDRKGGVMDSYYGPVYSHKIFMGGETARDSWETYLGATWALNRNLAREGVLFRVMGSYGQYEYTEVCPPPQVCSYGRDPVNPDRFKGRMWQGDVMVGYQWVRDRFDVALFAGIDHINHDISPDHPVNPVSGSETGFKVGLDLETHRRTGLPHYFALEGTYSTAFDTYWLLGRAGVNRGGNIFGVEGWLLGDATGDAQRLGAFVSFDRQLRTDLLAEISLSVGYQFVNGEEDRICTSFFGSEGAYATLNISFAFGDREPRHVPMK